MAVTPSNVPTNRAIDRLIKAANLQRTKKSITLNDGSVFEFYMTPLVLAEREKAQQATKNSDEYSSVTLHLVVDKATDENGQKLFSPGEISILKQEVRDSDLQKIMLAVISDDEDAIDVKN